MEDVVKEYTRQFSESGLISTPLSFTETPERSYNSVQTLEAPTKTPAATASPSYQFDVLGGPDQGSFDVLGGPDQGSFDVLGRTDRGGFDVLGVADRGAFDVLGGPDQGSFDVFGKNN